MSSTPQSATHLTFILRNFGGVMDKLRWEIEQHEKLGSHQSAFAESGSDPRAAIWMAINAAATAWSLIEWAEHDLILQGRSDALREYAGVAAGSPLRDVKGAIRGAHEVVDTCHRLSHAAKHASLRNIDPTIATTAHFNIYAREGRTAVHLVGRVATPGDPGAINLREVGLVLSEAMSWALGFARALGLPEHQ